MIDDPEQCYRAVASRDSRFDGFFVTAVHTTGIYCRPSCPAITPQRRNVSFFASAAAAQRNGYRGVIDAARNAYSPGSPEWNVRSDVVGRAMRLIADGVVDRGGVHGLAAQLGYSDRQLNRLLTGEMGAGPLALARVQRAQTARSAHRDHVDVVHRYCICGGLFECPPIQRNDASRYSLSRPPKCVHAEAGQPVGPGAVTVQLARREPYNAPGAIFAFLGMRAVPGVESWNGVTYSRVLSLPHGHGTVALRPLEHAIHCELRLDDWRDLQAVVQRCRRLLDLDADPVAVDALLGADSMLAPLVNVRPGLRSPAHVDGNERSQCVPCSASKCLWPERAPTRRGSCRHLGNHSIIRSVS